MKRDARKHELEKLGREVEGCACLPGRNFLRKISNVSAPKSRSSGMSFTTTWAWQRTLLARHPQRPYMMDYVRLLFEGFHELHGDRAYGDDPAMIAGFAKYHGRPVAVIGQQKGRDTKQRVALNFGQAKPEGYRKALRVMHLARNLDGRFLRLWIRQGRIGNRRRGARTGRGHRRNLREMARLPVPIVVTITGEGGSAARWRLPWGTA